ncbi:hypothetical protein DRP53_09500 [candidate division WOR-3 bacterium]|uniref:non-specific serine/threonine protein kinase n=1 Tax=candidate division WOR-3 bacterium TaxID=2052148 RepID=A0A660SDV5_UNCW3|nr:MAG: hypothetical protein DRP53_09500 [candidate division WOR-3 bacterium]
MLERIRNFEIKDLIATGGMAAVYRATQVTLDRDVAVKVLHEHLAQDENFIKRFEREAKAAASLKHENIVDIIDYGREEGRYFIAMEYVDGRSLKSILDQIHEVPIEVALKITSDVLKGLEYAHKKGVIHRDIKPGNILLSYEGKAKIVDFGLAKAREQSSLTVTGALVGTPAYMSPEQAVGKEVDHRSDLFSLGIVLYEMLTGVQPFRGETYSGVINEIISKTPRPISQIKPAIYDAVEGLLSGLLAKDCEKRFSDARSARESLGHVVKDLGIELSDDIISDFLKDPVRYSHLSRKRLADRHLRRGLYLMKLGLDRIDDAIREFERVLAIDPDNAEAKEKLEQLKRKRKTRISPLYTIPLLIVVALIALLVIMRGGRVEVTYPSLTIQTVPDSATILLDGQKSGVSPLRLDSLSRGRHIVEAKRAGYLPAAETLDLMAGSTSIVLVLKPESRPETKPESVVRERPRPEPRPQVKKTGFLVIKSTPKADIYINGRSSGTRTELPPGQYEVVVKKEGYQVWRARITVVAGKEVVREVRLKSLSGWVSVKSKPWADLFIDGEYITTTPIKGPIRLKPGYHRFKLANPDYWPWEDTLYIRPGETLKILQELVPK